MKIKPEQLLIPVDELASYSIAFEEYDSGHLRIFGPEDGWHLELDDGIEKGTAIDPNGSGGTADMEIYSEGTWERYDAWSDNSRAVEAPFDEWVLKWIESICKRAIQHKEMREQAEKTRKEIAAKGKKAVIKPVD